MKTAAIWWRVSTDDQREISPDTQTGEALALAEQEGYSVPPENVIGTDWSSLSVWNSPTMGQLKALVLGRAINAIFMYDADRGPSKPVHRLMFRALCEENGVAVRCCHGEIPGGEMGELMEFLSAWAKEKQVHRAQQGAKDGLRDRARLKGLPATGKCPYGYQFRYEDRHGVESPVAFEPRFPEYLIAQRIWKACIDGRPIRQICRELMADGLPAPKGGAIWAPATVGGILKNPVYGGSYYALRREKVVPKERRRETYRSSSSITKPLDAAVLLDFPVISPIVSWEEWESVQARLALNKLHSKRSSKQLYLLSGMAFCAHDGRRLSPRSQNGPTFYYGCSLRRGIALGVEPCELKSVNGARLEAVVWDGVSKFLKDPKVFMAEVEKQRGESGQERGGAESKIEELHRKLQTVENKESKLAGLLLNEKVTESTFERQGALLRAERTYHLEEIDRQEAALSTMEKSNEAINAMVNVRDRIAAKLDSATAEDRRWVLQGLATRVEVGDSVTVSIGTNQRTTSVMHSGKSFLAVLTRVETT